MGYGLIMSVYWLSSASVNDSTADNQTANGSAATSGDDRHEKGGAVIHSSDGDPRRRVIYKRTARELISPYKPVSSAPVCGPTKK